MLCSDLNWYAVAASLSRLVRRACEGSRLTGTACPCAAEERHFSPHATDVPSQPAFEVLHRGSLDSSGYTPRSPSPPPMGQSTLLGRLSVDGGSRPHPSRRPSLATASFGPSPSASQPHANSPVRGIMVDKIPSMVSEMAPSLQTCGPVSCF